MGGDRRRPGRRRERGVTPRRPRCPIVLAASASWETPAPVNAHHVARRLAARGHRGALRRVGRPAAAGAARLGPRPAPHRSRGSAASRRGVREVGAAPPRALAAWSRSSGPPALRGRRAPALVARGAARAARRLGFERPLLWAFLPTALPLADRLGARVRSSTTASTTTPRTRASTPRWVDAARARMLARADVVFATSASLAERLRARGRRAT